MRLRWFACFLVGASVGCQSHSSEPGARSAPGESTATASNSGSVSVSPPYSASSREFTSVRAMLDVIPARFRPDASGNWTDLKVAAANRVLAREVLGHPARLSARVQAAGIAPGTFDRRLKGLPRTHLSQPAVDDIPVTLYAYFPTTSVEILAGINPGDAITVAGTVSRAELKPEPNGQGARLNVDLAACRMSR